MGRIMNALVAYLTAENLPYLQTQSQRHLLVPAEGESGAFNCLAETREEQEQMLFYAMIPFRVPAERRYAIAEYIVRANTMLAIGSFDLDLDDGLVAYKTAIEVASLPLVPDLIRPLIEYAVAEADRHMPGLRAVLSGVSPVDAIKQIERYSFDEVMSLASDLLGE